MFYWEKDQRIQPAHLSLKLGKYSCVRTLHKLWSLHSATGHQYPGQKIWIRGSDHQRRHNDQFPYEQQQQQQRRFFLPEYFMEFSHFHPEGPRESFLEDKRHAFPLDLAFFTLALQGTSSVEAP
jgi:hypothetical protein